jgi:pyruvate/2-oxoglutarate dehydrogenase complex dihydrolipoamide acyltransferase (E2) component
MPVISVRIPQLGEGLQEALLVEFLKEPGDQIKRDEPIYVMETDKATTDVESPYDGTLVEWTVESGSVLEIGTEIAKMEVAEGVKEMPAGHGPEASTSGSSETASVSTASRSSQASAAKPKSKVVIPPKTRKYLKDHQLLDSIDQIPVSGSKMMPSDVDNYLAAIGGGAVSSENYELKPLPKSQIVLNYRLVRGASVCVPVTVINEIDWSSIAQHREQAKASGGGPTGFAMACWSIVQALKNHEKFRSSLTADGNSLKVFHHVNLGIAVALPGDEMVAAVVENADELSAEAFFAAYEKQVHAARDGKDQADESTTVTVSNIGRAGMRIGVPAIVAPSVATIAIGEVYDHPVPQGDSFQFRPMVTMTMSFDHRIANGVGAASFVNEIKSNIENFQM